MGIIDQKILSGWPPTVKEKFDGWILLDNSSYDEYYESAIQFRVDRPDGWFPNSLGGKNGPDSYAL
jgi:hypothetical protein